MSTDVFCLYSEIIELLEKPLLPSGEMGTNVEGNSVEFDNKFAGVTTYRAIIDIGLLDVERKQIEPVDTDLKFAGASSDMIVMNLGENLKHYKVGDLLEFRMNYMGTLRVLNSRYIEKKILR